MKKREKHMEFFAICSIDMEDEIMAEKTSAHFEIFFISCE